MNGPVIVRPSKGDGYPIWVADEARAMHCDGKTNPEIVRALAARGVIGLTTQTVLEWTNESFRQRRRDINSAYHARQSVKRNGGRIAPRSTRPEYVEGRIVALGTRGLTVDQIDVIVALDFGLRPGQERVLLALHQAGVVPPPVPGRPARFVAERDCSKCGVPFRFVKGARGRPPKHCDDCSTHPERVAITRRMSAAPAVANGVAAPTTNPTGRPS